MSTTACPDPEVLARFASQASDAEEWRQVVRHLSDCDLCRRQVALVAEEIPDDLPLGSDVLPALRPARRRVWPRGVGAVAAALFLAAIGWALVREPWKRPQPEPPPTAVRTSPAPTPRPSIPSPTRELPEEKILPDAPIPLPPLPLPPPVAKDPLPVAPTPAPPTPAPASPFLVERTRSAVSQAIEVVLDQGLLSRVSSKGTEPLGGKATVQPSDTLTSSDGGSLALPDGSTLHLAPEAEVRVAWSQTLECTTVDVRSGDAVVDLGKNPKPLFVSYRATGVQLRKSVGRVCVSVEQGSLRATLLSGGAEVQTRAGGVKTLTAHQSLVLRESGDALESVEKPDVSRFSTLDPAVRVPPGVAPPRPGADARPPALDLLAAALAGQSYAYKVSGREMREGVWSPSGIYTSTIESVTSVRKADDPDTCHFQRGSRPWDELGKMAPGSRDAHLVDLLRGLKAPHLVVQEWAALVSSAKVPRTEKVRDRLCLVWELSYGAEALRKSMEAAIEAAVADGRMQRPDFIYWETLDGGLEAAALKYEQRLMRVVDRRRVSYSYKTVSALDRRTYQLETAVEFLSHGTAAFPLTADQLKRLNLGPQ